MICKYVNVNKMSKNYLVDFCKLNLFKVGCYENNDLKNSA